MSPKQPKGPVNTRKLKDELDDLRAGVYANTFALVIIFITFAVGGQLMLSNKCTVFMDEAVVCFLNVDEVIITEDLIIEYDHLKMKEITDG